LAFFLIINHGRKNYNRPWKKIGKRKNAKTAVCSRGFCNKKRGEEKNEKEGLVKYLSILYPAFVKKKRG
jgi:hypothetical protein